MRVGARRLPGGLIFGAALAVLSAAAIAEDDGAVEWLVRMGDAARSANYQGVLVYHDDDMFETLRLVHGNHDGQERERMVSLSGEPREILRQNGQVTCLLPRREQLTTDNSAQHGLFPHMTRQTVRKLADYYELRLIGTARVAGRLCRGVRIEPRDAYRYGYEFWADEKTAVPLKVTLTTIDHERVEELVFTQVDFPRKIPDSAFASDNARADAQPVSAVHADARAAPAPSRWVLQQLPPGFAITMRDVRPLPDQRGNLEHLLVSDGLSAVSVFMASQPPPERTFLGVSHMGAVNAYGRMIGEFHIAVVGEVPAQTVRMIGDALRSADDPSPARESLIPPPTP